MPDSLQLGPYTLGAHIGRGGFSDVWLATLPTTRERLAIKAVHTDGKRREAARTAFLREADAVARLAHPAVVRLYDCGEVSEVDQARSRGKLTEGNPYLVMPLFVDGSLPDRQRQPLAVVQAVLDDVLRGLAHAHARGVLHLDIKPQNVLREHRGGRQRYVLTDFGAATLLDRYALGDKSSRSQMGTPLYMAPERLYGAADDEGPWSDIYSVAVMAWVLVTGSTPYPTDDARSLVEAHHRWGLPALPDGLDVPNVLRHWLARAGRRDPAARFASAAEAREALGTQKWVTETEHPPANIDPTAGFAPTTTLGETEFVLSRPPVSVEAEAVPAPAFEAQPAETNEWVRVSSGMWNAVPEVDSIPSNALGTGLLGRRSPAMAGREPDRDALWRALRRTTHERVTSVVVLEGAAGSGKSRLASWLGETAGEYCGALSLTAVHSPVAAPHDGLAAMFARGLRAHVSDLVELRAWAARLLERHGNANPFDADLLADFVAPVIFPATHVRPWTIRLASDDDRHEVAVGLLRRLAARRPVVLVIDDVQWGPASLAFVERLLTAPGPSPLPVTCVLTTRSEARLDHEGWAERLTRLLALPNVSHRLVAPLSADELAAMVRTVAPLLPDAAALVAERAEGNPLLALQLVEDWMRSGALRQVRGGYMLVDDRTTAPRTILEVWSGRVERALAEVDEAQRAVVREAIERAAALGTFVNDAEWSAVCADLPGDTLGLALHTLWSAQLCVLQRVGWAFAHALLRQAIDADASAAGRTAEQHARIANWLADGGRSERTPALLDRFAAHAEGAGWHAAAFDAALEAEHADTRAVTALTQVRVARAGRQLARMSPAERAERRLRYELDALRTNFLTRRDPYMARAALVQLRDAIAESGNEALLWDADLFELDLSDEQTNAAWKAARGADLLARAQAMGDAGRASVVAAILAISSELRGRPEEALAIAESEVSPVAGTRVFYARTSILAVQVRCTFDLGRFAEGMQTLRKLDALVRSGGSRDAMFIFLTLRCEALVRHGEWAAATATLDEALDLALTQQRDRDILLHVHRCALHARSGSWEECLDALELAMEPARAVQSRGKVAYGIGYASVAMAQLGRTDLWDALVPRAMADLVSWGIHEPILERCFADAGVAWRAAGDEDRARASLERAVWGLTGHLDAPARARAERLLESPELREDHAAPFLADVSAVLSDCPAWLKP